SRVSYFILDEADRMLDMGFYDDIMQIVAKLPKERQTLMFSATMPPKIKQLAKAILNDPVEVKTAISRPADGIEQSAAICYEEQKTPFLKHLFKTHHSKRVIIFAASKLKVKELTRELRRFHWKVDEMHSDLDQQRRDDVILDFRAGRTDILVATDIVARGIDIDDIAMVVNYDVPREAEDYVHRVGRTARAGTDGKAITLVSVRDQSAFAAIEEFLETEIRKEEIPAELGETPAYNPQRRKPARGKRFKGNKWNRNRGKNGNKGKNTPKPDNDASASGHDKKPETKRNNRNRKKHSSPKTPPTTPTE
ncbi:MAG: DEAD/DEAH box helicase, partial [Muribaculaceae bacterium]|nr:DEAD/DEAH box helicase [Muribaculaceae bacterium]